MTDCKKELSNNVGYPKGVHGVYASAGHAAEVNQHGPGTPRRSVRFYE